MALLAFVFFGCGPARKTVTTKPTIPLKPETPAITPEVPAPEAPLHISVAYPVPDQWRPNVDSNFIFGTTGNGHAQLTINGVSVPVWKNGAFLAFLRMPADGQYRLEAHRGADADSRTVSYRNRTQNSGETEETSRAAKTEGKSEAKLESPAWARIVKGSDTLQTGNDVAPGALTPDGNREWFFPRGCELHVTEQQGKYYKVELDRNNFAWVADSNFALMNTGRSTEKKMASESLVPSAGYVDLILPCSYHPFQINAEATAIQIKLYTAPKPQEFNTQTSDPLIANVGYDSTMEGTQFTVLLTKPVWGYKAFYLPDGALDVRIRRPPTIDRTNPFKGIAIMLDPGHPPGGAIGPTGLTEREANMAEAVRLRQKLLSAGATVLMTHTDLHGLVSDENQVQELDARTSLAVWNNVDLYVSMHNNAFPDGTNPFLNYGTSTYYYWPFSATLAADLDREIAQITGIPNLGSRQKSLAVCRPTWMPCALTESLFMMFPDQEAELRDPAFLDKLAQAHLDGIADFLRERAQ